MLRRIFGGALNKTKVQALIDAAASAVQITYTGGLRQPIAAQVVAQSYYFVPISTVSGVPVAATSPSGVGLASLSYQEFGLSVPGMTVSTLSFDNVVSIGTSASIQNCPELTSLAFPLLQSVTGAVTLNVGLDVITTISMPSLVQLTGNLTIADGGADTLTAVSMGALKHVGGSLGLTLGSGFTGEAGTLNLSSLVCVVGTYAVTAIGATGLTAVNLSALKVVTAAFNYSNMPSVTVLSAPVLACASSNISITNMPALTTINLPGLVAVGGSLSAFSGNGNITTVTLGTIGTLKKFGDELNFSGQKLTQASVDQILASLASLDGTAGTTSWAGEVDVSGGTSATPSAAGLVSKGIIVTRGGTVTHN